MGGASPAAQWLPGPGSTLCLSLLWLPFIPGPRSPSYLRYQCRDPGDVLCLEITLWALELLVQGGSGGSAGHHDPTEATHDGSSRESTVWGSGSLESYLEGWSCAGQLVIGVWAEGTSVPISGALGDVS